MLATAHTTAKPLFLSLPSDFPQHTLKKAFALKPQKKAKIIELVCEAWWSCVHHSIIVGRQYSDFQK